MNRACLWLSWRGCCWGVRTCVQAPPALARHHTAGVQAPALGARVAKPRWRAFHPPACRSLWSAPTHGLTPLAQATGRAEAERQLAAARQLIAGLQVKVKEGEALPAVKNELAGARECIASLQGEFADLQVLPSSLIQFPGLLMSMLGTAAPCMGCCAGVPPSALCSFDVRHAALPACMHGTATVCACACGVGLASTGGARRARPRVPSDQAALAACQAELRAEREARSRGQRELGALKDSAAAAEAASEEVTERLNADVARLEVRLFARRPVRASHAVCIYHLFATADWRRAS